MFLLSFQRLFHWSSISDPYEQLPAIFWLMGSLASARYSDLMVAGFPMAAGMAGLYAVRWQINAFHGRTEARSVLILPQPRDWSRLRYNGHCRCGLCCGIIGWWPVIPHIGRMLIGNDHKLLSTGQYFPGCLFPAAGGLTGQDCFRIGIPLSILTSLLGGPFLFTC